MNIFRIICLLLLFHSQLPAQNALSVELNPHFFGVFSNVEDVPSYLLLNPVIQVNYRIGEYVQPYARIGKAFASGDDITSASYQEYGIGTRLFFDQLIPFKDDWTVKHIDLFGFFDYSITDYGLTETLLPIPTSLGDGRFLRAGLGMTMRVGNRFSVGVDFGHINRKVANQSDSHFLKAARVGYHFRSLKKKP